jgi:glucosamine--fructose-6-phosphate aminotransferase (isomerizing)
MTTTPFESDIAGEPEALRRFAASGLAPELSRLDLGSFERVVLCGMGSSHHAAYPTWRRLVTAGVPAWWLAAPYVLDCPELISPRTLLVLTSQSGRSGEIVTLLERLPALPARARPRLIAVTNDASSPLAESADVLVELHSGDEASVSTKSYANTLAAHQRMLGAIEGCSDTEAVEAVVAAAGALERLAPEVATFAKQTLADRQPRLVLVADAMRTPSALFGGLILKEAAKIPAEGFAGGEFRHGPLELAGPGLSAVIFRNGGAEDSLERLAADLVGTGTRVLNVGTAAGGSGEWVLTGAGAGLSELVCDAKVAQLLSVELARAGGVVPGAFRFGSKITTIL